MLLVAVLYAVAGIGFAALAKSAASHQMVVAWRLAAWLVSAAAFAAHIGYENLRLRSSAATTASHVALAAGLGAFGLALAATLHSHATQQHFPVSALVIWPVITALPAFLVALALAAALTRVRRNNA